jgi:putative phosphonate metabolism protein
MFARYAIFYTPTGALADFGARWLGWDSAQGCAMPHPENVGTNVADITQTPRKYGLHGTLKAPFHLAKGCDLPQLRDAAVTFAAGQAAFEIGALDLQYESGFVALRPRHSYIDLQDFAAATVKAFDAFRAPLPEADITRRRAAKLTIRQDQQMLEWGYPFIFEDFHFHLTLTGRLEADTAAQVISALAPHLERIVPAPFMIDAITLMGQDAAGMFHQIHRYALTG